MGEFDLIRRFFQPLSPDPDCGAVVLGIGDDCAIQQLPSDQDLVFSVDTMVEGVHFPQGYRPDFLGWRALAAAASDLAAMGAEPVCFTLALTLPEADETWLEAFAGGLASASAAFGLPLAGGDTTRGPLTLSIQVHGTVPSGCAIRRSGAGAGDLICVSGTLGNAGAALDYLEASSPTADMLAVLESYHHPVPRLEAGKKLRGVATAAIDISDGLLADLGHLLEASGTGARVDVAALPLSAPLCRLKGAGAADYALRSGDDYELCVTVPPQRWALATDALKSEFTVIGQVEKAPGLRLSVAAESAGQGFDHFGRSS